MSSDSAVRASQDVRAVIGRLRRRIRAVGGSDAINMTQASVLGRLIDHGGSGDSAGLTVADLAAAEGMRHQSMAVTVGGLAARGLVERHQDPADGRRMLISITAEGRHLAEEGRRARGEWLAAELQKKCTDDERRTVIAAMAILRRIVDE